MADQGKSSGNPKKTAQEMLSRTYDQLEVKDMSREAFVNEAMGVLIEKKKRKNSPLILPD